MKVDAARPGHPDHLVGHPPRVGDVLEDVGGVADVEGLVGERQLHPAAEHRARARSRPARRARRRRRRGRSTWRPRPRTRSGSSPGRRRRRASSPRPGRRTARAGRPSPRPARRRRRPARSAPAGRRGRAHGAAQRGCPGVAAGHGLFGHAGDHIRWGSGRSGAFLTGRVRMLPAVPGACVLMQRVAASTAVTWEDTPRRASTAERTAQIASLTGLRGFAALDGRARPRLGADGSTPGSGSPATARSASSCCPATCSTVRGPGGRCRRRTGRRSPRSPVVASPASSRRTLGLLRDRGGLPPVPSGPAADELAAHASR